VKVTLDGGEGGTAAAPVRFTAPDLADAAVLERDAARRAEMYREIQKLHQETSPFVIMFQDIETIAERTNVEGTIWGPSFDDNRYWQITKN